MFNISGFGEHLAGLISSVGTALAMFCQTTLHNVSQRRTIFVAVKGGNSARFKSDLPDAKLTLCKVVQSLLAKRVAR